jgi:hypothetical protein
MPSDKKRLFFHAQALLLGFVMAFLFVSGCKKKDRLTASTFRFSVTPPAASVLKNGSVPLIARGSSPSGNVDVNPTWTLSPTSIGTLTPNIGNAVVFTGSALGDATITATYDGMAATSHIAVVAFISTPTVFEVYTDRGLPSGADLFFGGLTVTQSQSGYTPEGIKYFHTDNTSSGFWEITLDPGNTGISKDLSSYSALKFDLRLGRALAFGESLAVQVQDTSSTKSHTLASGDGDYNALNTGWQEISIPLSAFSGLDSMHIKIPFIIVVQTVLTPLSFDVDAIRWSN